MAELVYDQVEAVDDLQETVLVGVQQQHQPGRSRNDGYEPDRRDRLPVPAVPPRDAGGVLIDLARLHVSYFDSGVDALEKPNRRNPRSALRIFTHETQTWRLPNSNSRRTPDRGLRQQ